MEQVPKNFLVGAATAAHQVEGNNRNSDCWALEQSPYGGYSEPSLDACDHYHRYQEDIRLMAKAGLNAYRFSVEWARIEPEEGQYDDGEIRHYQDVIACCKQCALEPVITLHHFSSPVWLIRKGGWEAETTVAYFARYARFVAQHLGKDLHYICTINEANMGLQIMSVAREFLNQMAADGKIQMGLSLEALMAGGPEKAAENMRLFGTTAPKTFQSPRSAEGDALVLRAHQAARQAIKEICPWMKVGLTLSLHDVQALPGGEQRAEKEWDEEFSHYVPYICKDEFLGVQNYSRTRYGAEGTLPVPKSAEQTQMGYEFYPEGISHVLRRVAGEYHGELLVTENGVATGDDTRRIAFIREALDGIFACVEEDLPVKAYFYWSLLDNFEWQKGYSMTFGLIGVDRKTQARKPKDSLFFLGQECRRTQ